MWYVSVVLKTIGTDKTVWESCSHTSAKKKNINFKKENKMVCKCDCPIHSKCDNVNEGKQCIYNANWVDEIKYNPKHW